MTTWVRDADDDEAVLLALAAHESGVGGSACRRVGQPDCAPGPSVRECVRVATTDGQVSGYYRLVFGGACAHAGAELDYLLVHERWRRRGVGRLLVRDMRRRADQLGWEFVRIVAHPPTATFFRHIGAVRRATLAPSVDVPWTRPVFELVGLGVGAEAESVVAATLAS